MRLRRFVVPRESIAGDHARLRGALHHYLCHVLRLQREADVELVDGSGARYRGRIEAISAEEILVALEQRRPPAPAALPRLVLVYGLSRKTRTEWVLQKATELGIDCILPAPCERSVSRPSHPERTLARWLEIVQQAARQCGRSTIPLLSAPLDCSQALAEAASADLRLLATEGGARLSTFAAALGSPSLQSVALAVGPEGGFSPLELEQATDLGYARIGLGPLVLRTETAALSFLTLVAYLCGRLDQ